MKRFIKYFLCLLISLCVFAGTGCGFDVFGSGSRTAADAPLIIRMLDIGQGDAILIERNGKFALIDTGDVEHRPRMAEYLRKYGVKKGGYRYYHASPWRSYRRYVFRFCQCGNKAGL